MTASPRIPRHFAARFLTLARILSSASFRSAAPIALPFYFTLLLAASILFGPQGLEAKTVISAFSSSPFIAFISWAAWILFTLPIARAALYPPDTAVLRTLPLPRLYFIIITGFHLFMIELPWTLLWLRGSAHPFLNIWTALSAASGAAGAHALLCARSKSLPSILSGLTLLPIFALSAKNPIVLLACIPIIILSLRIAHKNAYERPAFSWSLHFPAHNKSAALGIAYLAGIARENASIFSRALFTTLLGALIAPFIARGYSLGTQTALGSLSLAIATAFMLLSIDSLAQALLRTENQMRWILDSNSIHGLTRTFAFGGAAALCGASLGILHGAVFIYMLRSGIAPIHLKEFLSNSNYISTLALRILLLSAFQGIFIGFITSFNARLSNWDGPKREGRGLVRTVVFTIAACVAFYFWGELTLLAFALLTAFSIWRSSRIALKLPPSAQKHSHAYEQSDQ